MVSDAIARFQRLDGFDVRFLTGTDEHGLKMQQTAISEGLTPIALADRNSARFREMMKALNVSFDDYIRTTEPRHKRACQALWSAIEKNGDIYLDKYAGWYSVRQEAYFDEGETTLGDDGVRREPLDLRSNGRRRRPISSASRRIRTSCSISTRAYRISCCRVSGSTKSRASSKAACRTCQYRGRLSIGASSAWRALACHVRLDGRADELHNGGRLSRRTERSFRRYWPANLHVIGKDISAFMRSTGRRS